MRTERFVALAVLAATWLASSSANAFCRTTTGLDRPENGCPNEGLPVFYPSQCFAYRLLTRDSTVIPNAVLSEKLGRAFAAWVAPSATCTPGIDPIELAPAPDTVIASYTTGGPGRNIVGVAPSWMHTAQDETMSLTTVTFTASTGEVLDVDLEINGEVPWSFASEAVPNQVDLESVLVHEVGHMVGIAHSDVAASAMTITNETGTIVGRTVTEDDRAAICTIYPNRSQRLAGSGLVPSTTCDLAPGGPSDAGGCGEPEIKHGCAASTSGTSSNVSWIALLGLGLTVIRVRQRASTTRS